MESGIAFCLRRFPNRELAYTLSFYLHFDLKKLQKIIHKTFACFGKLIETAEIAAVGVFRICLINLIIESTGGFRNSKVMILII